MIYKVYTKIFELWNDYGTSNDGMFFFCFFIFLIIFLFLMFLKNKFRKRTLKESSNSKLAANTGDQNLWNCDNKSQVRVSGNQPYKHSILSLFYE